MADDGTDQGVREVVRTRYAALATAVARSTDAPDGGSPSCCGSAVADPAQTPDEAKVSCCGSGEEVFGSALYSSGERDGVPKDAASASLGCGNPLAVAELQEGETVLDLGSGGGMDVLLSAERVGPAGKAYGLDMTDEMLSLARENQRRAGADNVEWLKGHIEDVPLPASSVDVVISNCVINLSADKPRVLAEAARVLRPGGRFAVMDVIADPDMDPATRRDMEQWTGCVAGALTRAEFVSALEAAGFDDIEVTETHRVHRQAASAIVRARR
jgi:ubiquinone/menaquinone biosynthesis C-methylase UbiE